ncbi:MULTISPECIES: MFS transporter [unclassified Modicisalibacter]|uniref:MFS transporter n=1 Tax=unclassified Modicisalibacter TaxID=2679913 RepID=UPI001CCE0367|nr:MULTISPECIES: MFS transporter [unclassified Modicisalibacter]MBZ9559674.1 MFS transporter [Modicisalibacter sp. R2A 31.J]MBZ9577126.1 MFS transporter [Modicisalibacter sp. MOD 31.J]
MSNANAGRHALVALTVVLVGLNLRPIMAAVGPILASVQSATGIGDTTAGLLTTLPVLAMGLFALLGGMLQRVLGVEKTVQYGLVMVGAATLARLPFHGEAGLIATAAAGGIGIAVIQATLPGMIKRDHGAKAGQLMALYTVGIMAGAMVSSSLVAPLSAMQGWPVALSVWAAFAILALLGWRRAGTPRPGADAGGGPGLPMASPRAWYLMLFFGIGTAAYTLVLAWLPPFYVQLGWSETASGFLLGGLTLAQVVAAVGLSSVVDRFPDRRPVFYVILVVIALGLLSLIVAPQPLALPALLLLGLGIGGLFPMSLIIAVDHLQAARQAGALLGFVQGGGYIIASVMPFLAGLLRDAFDDLTLAWGIMLVGILVQMVMVPRLSPGDSLSSEDWRLHSTARS